MIKHLTVKHFIFALVSFWIITLLTADRSFETTHQFNLILAGIFLALYNPADISKKQYFIMLGATAFAVLISFVLPLKTWSSYLFFLLCGGYFILGFKKTAQQSLALLIIWCASFFNLCFITNTHIGDVQYDFASCFNYIEYIMEDNFKFWQENPLLTRPSYSAYHPILHFFLTALAIRSGEWLSFSKDVASEASQIVIVSYMLWYGLIVSRILNLFNLSRGIYFSTLAMVVFFPTYNAISGFFNNDCLLLPLQAGIVYYSLTYLKDGCKKNLAYILLFATLAALTKLSGVLILPLTAAVFLLRLLKQRNKQTFYEELICGILLLIGISIWPLYQHFILNVDFSFVPPQTHLSLENYTLWQRFNPLGAFVYEQMYYNDFGINLWETMTKTALFGQWDFTYRGTQIIPLITLLVYVYKTIIAVIIIAVIYLIFKAQNKKYFYLSLILLLSLLIGQILFGLKHPFMCNQDFRYIAVLPLAFAMILGSFMQQINSRLKNIVIGLLVIFALLSAFIWNWVSA